MASRLQLRGSKFTIGGANRRSWSLAPFTRGPFCAPVFLEPRPDENWAARFSDPLNVRLTLSG